MLTLGRAVVAARCPCRPGPVTPDRRFPSPVDHDTDTGFAVTVAETRLVEAVAVYDFHQLPEIHSQVGKAVRQWSFQHLPTQLHGFIGKNAGIH